MEQWPSARRVATGRWADPSLARRHGERHSAKMGGSSTPYESGNSFTTQPVRGDWPTRRPICWHAAIDSSQPWSNIMPNPKIPGTKPHWPLEQVKQLLAEERYRLQPNAVDAARFDFGWLPEDMVECLRCLSDADYYKTEPHGRFPATKMDYYKCWGTFEGENVYVHLYVHPATEWLVISSFKRV